MDLRSLFQLPDFTPVCLLTLIVFSGSLLSADANAVPVTLTITKVRANEQDPEEGLEALGESTADLYVEVQIASFSGSSFSVHVDDDPDIEPFWTFTTDVPLSNGTAPVTIFVFDHDDTSADDQADADPDPGGKNVDLVLDLATGTWSGETSGSCLQGTGGEGVLVCWDLSVLGAGGDADGDAMLDGWELQGFDANGGGIDVDLPAMGADPMRKDLFLEIDCLVSDGNNNGSLADPQDHSHCPTQTAIQTVVQSFANAPVPNPDGTTGVQLHIDTGPLFGAGVVFSVPGNAGVVGNFGDLGGGGDQIAEAGNEIIDYDGPTGNPGTNYYNLKSANFSSTRRHIFRYAFFGHQTNARSAANDCTSGVAEEIPGNDLYITLGGRRDLDGDGTADGPCWADTFSNGLDDDGDGLVDEDLTDGIDNDGDCTADTDADGVLCDSGDVGVDEDGGFSVGNTNQIAGTLMHEFGHTIGLKHGGNDRTTNNKPNYLSVMNYSFQACSVPGSPLSGGIIPGGCDYSGFALPPAPPTSGALDETSLDECAGIDNGNGWFGPMDWNGDSGLQGTSCASSGANVSVDINNDSTTGSLPGWDDWANLFFHFRDLAVFANGIANPVQDEPDPETLERARTQLGDRLAPDIGVTVTTAPTALPGETVPITAAFTNTGSGPALELFASITDPYSVVTSYLLDLVAVGDTESIQSSFTIPDDACPEDLVTKLNGSFKDFVGRTSGLTASSVTTVLDITPPELTVTASPSILWPPDHKMKSINVLIEVTDECDPNPVVRLLSAVSDEPDNGTGDGDTINDIQGAQIGTADEMLALRSELSGTGDGRVYTLSYEAEDASGNKTHAQTMVMVPHDDPP